MQMLLVLTAAMLSPLIGLGLLLWLTHLEETLPRDVHAARRQPPPAPILAIAVSTPVRPLQEPDPQQVLVPAQLGQAFSRSATLSLGGSTNR